MVIGHIGISRAVISSYSDLYSISPEAREIHFRKFVSKNLLEKTIERFSKLERITMSESAFNRLNSDMLYIVEKNKLKIEVSSCIGRPSLLERGSL